MRTLSALVVAVLLASPAATQPAPTPPPEAIPAKIRGPVEGYNLARVYTLWLGWVESQKGAAAEQILARAPPGDGRSRELIGFRLHGDYGTFAVGDVRAACPSFLAASGCRYTYRSAASPEFILDGVGAGGGPVLAWARQAFRPAEVVARLKAMGVAPDADLWRVDTRQLFADMPSAVPTLVAAGVVHDVSSDTCPALAEALAVLDTKRLDWRLDLPNVGEDAPLKAPNPHRTRHLQAVNRPSWRGGRRYDRGRGRRRRRSRRSGAPGGRRLPGARAPPLTGKGRGLGGRALRRSG